MPTFPRSTDGPRDGGWIFNRRTGERRKMRPDERFMPDGWGFEVNAMLMTDKQGVPNMTHTASPVTINDLRPEPALVARKLLGDEAYFAKARDTTVSMTRVAVNAFWGVDSSRSDEQEVALFKAIAPLLDAGVKTMVGVAGTGQPANPFAVSDEQHRAVEQARQEYVERMSNAWKGPGH